jgi:hypothetical protein
LKILRFLYVFSLRPKKSRKKPFFRDEETSIKLPPDFRALEQNAVSPRASGRLTSALKFLLSPLSTARFRYPRTAVESIFTRVNSSINQTVAVTEITQLKSAVERPFAKAIHESTAETARLDVHIK